MDLERIGGRKSKALEEMYDEPCIVEFKDGQVYGGNVDEYEEGVFWLYNCKKLDKKKHQWKSHGVMREYKGKKFEDFEVTFDLSAVKDIYVMPSDFTGEYAAEDIMQFYINPHYKPLQGIKCNGGLEEEHSAECDKELHNALVLLVTKALYGSNTAEKDERKTEKIVFDALSCIRRRLLMYGAKIP